MTRFGPCRDRRGTAALEFGLVLPFMLMLLVGMLDVGRLIGDQHALDRGVAVAARYAIVNSASASATTITAQFDQAVQPLLGSCVGCTVTVTFSPSYQPGATVTVSATYAWTSTLPTLSLANTTLSSSITLTVQN